MNGVSASIILSMAQYPVGAMSGEVNPDTIYRLGLYYAPTLFVVWILMIWCLRLYRFDRSTHEQNLRDLGC